MDGTLVVILAIVFFAAFVRSTFGFGDALISMPLLVLLMEVRTATPLVAMIAWTIAVSILVRHWRDVRFKSAWRLVVSSVVGIPVGLYMLKGTHEGPLKIVLALVILVFAAWRLAGIRPLTLSTDRSSWLFGFAAGVLGGAYNTNGPPVVIYSALRRWPPDSFRATLQGYFVLTNAFILLGHLSAGLWTRPVLKLYGLSFPLVVLAILAGERLSRAIPRGRFDRLIHVLLLAIGLYLLVDTFTRGAGG